MAATPEELALELSRESRQSQDQTETQLREKATAVLSAASIVVPVAALAVGVGKGPAGAAIPFIVAAVAYFLCARECGRALLPRNFRAGLLGGQLLKTAAESKADLRQMQASAASYLDQGYASNEAILRTAAKCVFRAIVLLTVEILALAVALIITLVT
jgi:hypothetical protein